MIVRRYSDLDLPEINSTELRTRRISLTDVIRSKHGDVISLIYLPLEMT